MDAKLPDLISYYEGEEQSLMQSMNEFVHEGEYLFAHYCSEELGRVKNALGIFKKFKDPLYDKKRFLIQLISMYRKIKESTDNNHMHQYYDNEIFKLNQKLDSLNNIPIVKKENEDETILDIVLQKLAKREISSFKIFYKKSQNFYLKISVIKKQYCITITNLTQLLKSFVIDEDHVKRLMAIGFKYSATKERMTLTPADFISNGSFGLKELLAKLTFEILFPNDYEGDSFIEYKEKRIAKNL